MTEYFSKESGLILRKSVTSKGPGGQQATRDIDYSDYKDMGGIKIPGKMTIHTGMADLEFNVNDFKTNTGLSDSIFKAE